MANLFFCRRELCVSHWQSAWTQIRTHIVPYRIRRTLCLLYLIAPFETYILFTFASLSHALNCKTRLPSHVSQVTYGKCDKFSQSLLLCFFKLYNDVCFIIVLRKQKITKQKNPTTCQPTAKQKTNQRQVRNFYEAVTLMNVAHSVNAK